MATTEIKYNKDKKRLLEKILEDIDNGSATIQDYEGYESILTDSGIQKEKIHNKLVEHGVNDWGDYINR